jgi:hypothetical protein
MAAMTRKEYQELYQKIVELYEARVDEYAREMESEKAKDLQAIARIWRLEHDAEDPPTLTAARRSTKVSTNGGPPKSQKDMIRLVIKRLSGTIDTPKVLKTFGEVFCDEEHPPDKSTVSKVFREMIKEGTLECTERAGFQKAAQYVKT